MLTNKDRYGCKKEEPAILWQVIILYVYVVGKQTLVLTKTQRMVSTENCLFQIFSTSIGKFRMLSYVIITFPVLVHEY